MDEKQFPSSTPHNLMKPTTLLRNLAVLATLLTTLPEIVQARNFRDGMMPNGEAVSCSACHVRAQGGGERTSFGEAVNALVTRNGREEFWTPALAALDSDGDGASNGTELGDPDGDGVAIADAEVTNPGDPNSVPAAAAFLYEQNFDRFDNDTVDLDDGSIIASSDGINSVQGGALRVTDAATGGTGASFILPPFDASDGWSAKFDFSIEHSGGNTPADGFSFNYGEIPEGENFGSPAEEGYGEAVPHISFQVDTWLWDNTEQDAGVGIEVAGVEIAYNEAIGVEAANFQPNELVEASMLASWDPDKGASFTTLGLRTEADFIEVPVDDFNPDASYGFSILARTGGHSETFIIDNLAVGPLGSFTLQARDPKFESQRSVVLAAEFGLTGTAQFEVVNGGATQDLVIESATIGGASPDAFSVLTAFPLTIAPAASASVEIEFTAPNELGSVEAELALMNNDSSEGARTQLINLTGNPFEPSGNYSQDFDGVDEGAIDLGDGSIIFSNNESAKVTGGALQLTEDGIGGSSANFKLPPLGPDANEAFIVTFDLKLESEGQPADGFSFNYGNIADSATAGEEGFSSGLAVEFDTWDNGGEGQESGIGYDISVDGADLPDGVMRIAADDDKQDNRFFKFDGQFRPVEISWFKTGEDTGVFSLTVDGEVFYDNLPTPGFAPEPSYRFAYAARTGGAFETVQIDNLNVQTGTEDPNLFATSKVNSGVVQPDSGVQALEISLRNTGTETPLSVSSVTLTDSEVYTLGAVPTSIAPGDQGIVEVTLDPSKASGRSTAELTIVSNDPSEPTQVISFSVSVPLSSALVGWYKMDETGGNELIDSSGNNRNGTYFGDVVFGQDALALGTSVQLNSGGDAAYGNVPNFPKATNQSVSLWVQLNGDSPTGVGTLVSKSHPDDDASYSLSQFPDLDNLLGLVVSENAAEPSTFAVEQPLTAPSHVVMVYEDSNGPGEGADVVRLYVDGSEVAAVEDADGFADVTADFQIGARIGDNGIVGLIDDVQVYKVALTAEEVTALFNNPGVPLNVEVPETPSAPDGTVLYEQAFEFPNGTDDLGDGSIIASNDGTAAVQDNVLKLTEAEVNSTAAAFILPPFNASTGWTASFDFSIEHIGENTPADGFSFNYGAIPEGENYGSPAEEGYGTGVQHLSFQVDTWQWDNPDQDAGVAIAVSGSEASFNRALGDDANFKPEERVSASVSVSWDPANGMSFVTSGLRVNADFINVPASGFNADPEFGFSFLARTGGHNETLEIDNLLITAGATDLSGGIDPGNGGGGGGNAGDRFAILQDVVLAADGADGGMSFTLPEGVTADIEYSTDLVTWEVISAGATGNFVETDADRAAAAGGYYRARQP